MHNADQDGGIFSSCVPLRVPQEKGLFDTKKPAEKSAGLFVFGGDEQDRTVDLLTASQALSQLSYTPKK